MRPVPRFWTTVEGEASHADGRPLALRIWGWSTTSVAEAAAVAADRLAQARAKAAAGQRLDSWAYYPRMPLREETLAEVTAADGQLLAVVTRNRYGAEVLNTDLFLIADIDLPEESNRQESPRAGGGWLSKVFGRRPQSSAQPEPTGQASRSQERALRRVADFAAAHPDHGVQTYQTAAGLRVFVTGGDLPPGTPAAEQVLQELDSDPIYVRLCSNHQTYRARLTPKPWRCGHSALSVPWPIPPGREAEAQLWLSRYDELSAGRATTRKLSVSGPAPTAQEAQVIAVHDAVTRATEDVPLA